MIHLKTQYPIGMDFGTQDLYAAQLKKNGDGLAIREVVHRRFSQPFADAAESGDEFVSFIKETIKKSRFRGRRVIFNIPSQYVYTFPISFELGSNRTIEEAIVQELKGYLSFTVKEAIIDYPSIKAVSNGDTTQHKAIIVVAQKEKVEWYIDALKRAGLSVEAVDFNLTSLIRLHGNLFELSDNPVMLCHVGLWESTLCIVIQDRILACRNLNWGMQPILDSLQKNLELPNNQDQPMRMLEKYGLFYEDLTKRHDGVLVEDETENREDRARYRVIFQILSPYFDELINEFHQIVGYARAEDQQIAVKEVFMYGQANRIHHLDKHLEKRIDLPTRCIQPMAKGILSSNGSLLNRAESAPFDLALGLAMRKEAWL